MKKIKTVSTYSIDLNSNDQFLQTFLEYNESGNVVNSTTYAAEGEIESKTLSIYDEKNNKIEEQNFISEDEISELHHYERNDSGNLKKETIQYLDESTSLKIYNLNESEKILEVVMFDEDNRQEEKEIIKIGNADLVLEKSIFDEDNELREKQINEFDDDNRLIKRMEYGPKYELNIERLFTYNEKGSLIKRLTLNKNRQLVEALYHFYDEKDRTIETRIGESYLIKYTYDDDEKSMTEERFMGNGMLQYRLVSHYDENNLIIAEEDFNSRKEYRYTFFE